MKKVILVIALLSGSGCSHLGIMSEDAGLSALASDVSVPANGQVIYTIDRKPRTDPAAMMYYREMGTTRSIFDSFFGKAKGSAKTYINGGS